VPRKEDMPKDFGRVRKRFNKLMAIKVHFLR
jgi:hypothetical protein